MNRAILGATRPRVRHADLLEAILGARIVLNGFELGTDAQIVRYPDQYMDERGAVMWDRIMGLIDRQQLKMAA